MAAQSDKINAIVEGITRIETHLGVCKTDLAEIKAEVRRLYGCQADLDKRVALLERNGNSLHGELEERMAESEADRKELHSIADKMEMNWARFYAVVGLITGIMAIFGSELGKVGEAIFNALGH